IGMRVKFMCMRTRAMRARGIGRPLRILTFLATLLLPVSIQPAFAHEGHDHAAQTSLAGLEGSGMAETAHFAAQSDAFDVVLANRAQDAVVYVDSSATD